MAGVHEGDDGENKRCTAEPGNCPLEAAGRPHFDSWEEAQEHYESKMTDEGPAGISTKPQK